MILRSMRWDSADGGTELDEQAGGAIDGEARSWRAELGISQLAIRWKDFGFLGWLFGWLALERVWSRVLAFVVCVPANVP